MEPLKTDLAARLSHALDGIAVTGFDLAVGASSLLASVSLLAWVNLLTWPWTVAVIGLAGAAVVASARFRLESGARAWAWPDSSRTGASEQTGAANSALMVALRGLPDAAIVLDGRLAIVDANDPAREAFSIAPGRHIVQVTRAPDLLQAVDAALQHTAIQTFQLQLPPPLDRSFAVRVMPLGSRDVGQPAILILMRDMTEQERLSRMRADFVANASHELRTPLSSLKGFIETLQGAAKDDASARDNFLGIMEGQASRMSRLIDDLLSLSRIEMWEHVPPSGSVDLAEVVGEVATALKPIGLKSEIAIDASNLVRPAIVTGDKDEVTQLVQNLVQNAIKYGRRGGSVEIALRTDADRFELSVRDDGIGIAPHHLPRLTERFYRVSARESRERGGTGLGLAIVKHIVNRHRGELKVKSTQGVGSTFTVLLPRRPG